MDAPWVEHGGNGSECEGDAPPMVSAAGLGSGQAEDPRGCASGKRIKELERQVEAGTWATRVWFSRAETAEARVRAKLAEEISTLKEEADTPGQ